MRVHLIFKNALVNISLNFHRADASAGLSVARRLQNSPPGAELPAMRCPLKTEILTSSTLWYAVSIAVALFRYFCCQCIHLFNLVFFFCGRVHSGIASNCFDDEPFQEFRHLCTCILFRRHISKWLRENALEAKPPAPKYLSCSLR